jgi:hypothetical protein
VRVPDDRQPRYVKIDRSLALSLFPDHYHPDRHCCSRLISNENHDSQNVIIYGDSLCPIARRSSKNAVALSTECFVSDSVSV